MGNELQVFNSEEFGSVRTLMIDNEPWFVGKDVAEILGYENPTKAIRNHVDEDDKMMGVQNVTPSVIDSLGRNQHPTWINESGLYSLILSSKLPSAKCFKRWVTSEVLPALRKTGRYTMTQRPAPPVECRVLTTDDYIKASQIVAGCKNERLPYVIHLLKKGGFDFPEGQGSGDAARALTEDDLIGKSVNETYMKYGHGLPVSEFEDTMKCAFNLTVVICQNGHGRRRLRVFKKGDVDDEI